MNWKTFSLISAIVCLVVGLAVSNTVVSGVGKALAGVSFIMYYIFLLFGKMPSEKH